MFRVLSHIQSKLIYYLPLTMISAVLFGYFYDPSPLKSLMSPIIFLMVYPMMVTLRYKELMVGGNKRLMLVTQVVNFIIFPVIGYGIGKLLFPENGYIAIAFLLMALLPTSGMTISWTGFAKGNVAAAIKMMVTGLIIGAVATPVYLNFLMGESVDIPFISFLNEIIKVVFIPMILGYLTQKLLIRIRGEEHFNSHYKKDIPLIATAALLGIVFLTTAMRAKTIVSDPFMLIRILVILIAAYAMGFMIVTMIARSMFNREDGIALIYGTVMRNLSIVLAIALSIFAVSGSEVALVVAVAFVVQIQGAAMYLKQIDRFLGKEINKIAA